MRLWRRRPLPAEIRLSDPPVAVRLRVLARARRFTLRPVAGGGAVLTLPEGVREAEARDFLARHAGWLREALGRQPEPIRVALGTPLPVDGRAAEIAARPGRGPARLEDGRLLVPAGAAAGPAARAFLKARARARIAPLAEAHAAALGRPIAAIAFRDTRSRWGSCSAAGRLAFSWRIAMAPPEVQAYLAAHEAAHLVEMNHAPAFWQVVARLMPDHAAPKAWLRREGRALHRYRFD